MREALKTIASFYNPAQPDDGGQAAARLARQTLEDLGLLFQAEVAVDAAPSGESSEH